MISYKYPVYTLDRDLRGRASQEDGREENSEVRTGIQGRRRVG